ncbi:hypothetical protein GCM10023192_88680 [Amycolatopsis samaneae]
MDRPRPFDVVTETLLTDLDRAQVHRALAVLSDLQRESIMLTYLQGYSNRQAAERLGITPGTHRARVRDGLARLRVVLSTSR